MHKIKKTIFNSIPLIPGFKTSKKILVIESDDWGTIRTSSKQNYLNLLEKGYPIDQNPYCKFDSLENDQDIQILLETLSSVKNSYNQNPIFTFNNVVANPNFEKIKASQFNEYYFEPFYETHSKYDGHSNVMNLYHEGIKNKLLYPQYHGREHLNVNRWLKSLQKQEQHVLDGLENDMFSFAWLKNNSYRNEYMDSFDIDELNELPNQEKIFTEGYNLFEKIWNFKSTSFIANCYIWHPQLEKFATKVGVKYFQGLPFQFIPSLKKHYNYTKKFHYMGQVSKNNITYLVRNSFFEPSVYPNVDWIDSALNRINLAFKFNKPAILSSHRLNFIGGINENNRTKNIQKFEELLKTIVKKWPDIEFMASNTLGDYITK